MLETAILGGGLIVAGAVVALLSGRQLGVARAARKWQPEGAPRVGRGVASAASMCGLSLLAGGAAVLTLLVRLPEPTVGIRASVAAGAGVAALLVGMFGTARLADRVELNALIRSPSRARDLPGAQPQAVAGAEGAGTETVSDPVVPPTARPGWVYRDVGGAWYLVVSAGAGFRLVSLPDFRLAPAGLVAPPIALAGSVELAVWPLSEDSGARTDHTRATSR